MGVIFTYLHLTGIMSRLWRRTRAIRSRVRTRCRTRSSSTSSKASWTRFFTPSAAPCPSIASRNCRPPWSTGSRSAASHWYFYRLRPRRSKFGILFLPSFPTVDAEGICRRRATADQRAALLTRAVTPHDCVYMLVAGGAGGTLDVCLICDDLSRFDNCDNVSLDIAVTFSKADSGLCENGSPLEMLTRVWLFSLRAHSLCSKRFFARSCRDLTKLRRCA